MEGSLADRLGPSEVLRCVLAKGRFRPIARSPANAELTRVKCQARNGRHEIQSRGKSPRALPLPRIENRDAETGEVSDVPGDEGEPVVEGGGHDQAVRDLDLSSLHPALSGEYTPPFCNRGRHRQDAALESRSQCAVEPCL